tara:strand:+ start:678 stop:884 length:207 start_codon:yes stop_codon:yes gene_type:complete
MPNGKSGQGRVVFEMGREKIGTRTMDGPIYFLLFGDIVFVAFQLLLSNCCLKEYKDIARRPCLVGMWW